MLKKIMSLCCLLALFLAVGCGRETNKTENIHVASYPGWVEIKVGDQASFAVPPEMILQSQETRDELLKAPDLDPLLKKWLEADQEVVKSPGSVIVQSGKLDPVPWHTDEHLVWVEFKTMASPEKMPRYGQNIGLKGDEIKDFGENHPEKHRRDIQQDAARRLLPEVHQLGTHAEHHCEWSGKSPYQL